MTWKQNMADKERIQRMGQTVDLPLFDESVAESGMPSEIYDASMNKARVFSAIQARLPASRFRVFTALFELGRATDQQIGKYLHWEINRVTPRRQDLQKLGLIQEAGEEPGQYKFPNTVWTVNHKAVSLFIH